MRWRRPLLKTVSDHVKQEVCYQNLRHLRCLLREGWRHHEGRRWVHQLRRQGDGARRAQPGTSRTWPRLQSYSLLLNQEATPANPIFMPVLNPMKLRLWEIPSPETCAKKTVEAMLYDKDLFMGPAECLSRTTPETGSSSMRRGLNTDVRQPSQPTLCEAARDCSCSEAPTMRRITAYCAELVCGGCVVKK